MVCFMYRRGSVGKMTRILLTHYRAVCICVCVHTGPSGMKQWSQGSTLETWMTMVSMFSTLGQQDNPLKTWCVPLVLSIQVCKRPHFFFSVFFFSTMVGLFCADAWWKQSWQATPKSVEFVGRDNFQSSKFETSLGKWFEISFLVLLGIFSLPEQARAHYTTTNKYDITYRCLGSVDIHILPEAFPSLCSLLRLRSSVWLVFQWKSLLFSTACQFGEIGLAQ